MNKKLNFLLNLKTAYHLYKEYLESEQRRKDIFDEFITFVIRDYITKTQGYGFFAGDAWYDDGAAIKLAEFYKVELYGKALDNCAAYIAKENWKNDISPNVKSGYFGSFLEDEPHDKINTIYGFGKTMNEAIIHCLIFAKRAGVI